MTDNTKMREAMIDQDGAVWEKIGGAWSLYKPAQSVAVAGEPVAWVNINKHGDITRTVRRRDNWCTTPVFVKPKTSIPAAELATLREKAKDREALLLMLEHVEQERDELRKDAEKRDAREDRHWRAGFMDGWNAGVIGDESALKAAGERLDAAIAQGKGE